MIEPFCIKSNFFTNVNTQPLLRAFSSCFVAIKKKKDYNFSMSEIFSRTEILIGKENMKRLQKAKVLVFGVGGVGGYVIEALARSGISSLTIVDNDVVSLSNINRQIIATMDTVGKKKVDVMKERILSINPNCEVTALDTFYLPENSGDFNFQDYDYVVDAIDTVSAKVDIISKCESLSVPIISSMGCGNKMNPMQLEIADIYETSVCPLAKAMRSLLRKKGVKKCKVLYSREEALTPFESDENLPKGKRQIPGSNAFVPSAAGLIIASEVIKDLISFDREKRI